MENLAKVRKLIFTPMSPCFRPFIRPIFGQTRKRHPDPEAGSVSASARDAHMRKNLDEVCIFKV